MDASNQLPIDLGFLDYSTPPSKEVAHFIEKLSRIAVQRSDEKLLGLSTNFSDIFSMI